MHSKGLAPWHRRWGPARLMVAACCLWLAACEQPQPPSALVQLEQLEQRCVDAMVKNTCTVMTGPQASQTSDVVFVAGVGAIDAQAYREIRASGQAMCSTVRQACEKDWSSAQCRTGRSLWL